MTLALRSLPWRWIALYYIVAVAIAAPFNLGWTASWSRAHLVGTPLAVWPFLPAALGPAIGALLVRRLDLGTVRRTSLFGAPVAKNLLLAVLPVAVFAALGGRAALYAVVALVYSLGEEFGWRGYLADALAPLGRSPRYLITASLWWPWHLRFATPFELLLFPGIILLASVALGHAARESRSVVVPASMHSLIVLLTAGGTPSRSMVVAAGITLAGWLLIGTIWRKAPPPAA